MNYVYMNFLMLASTWISTNLITFASFEDGLKLVKLRGEAMQVMLMIINMCHAQNFDSICSFPGRC